MTNTAQQRLQDLLRTLFQFEDADLDFGIYRIMRQKRAHVEAFLNGLPERMGAILQNLSAGQQHTAQSELAQVRQQVLEVFGPGVFENDGSVAAAYQETPLAKRYQALREQSAATEQQALDESSVYNHLVAFFERYYDNGDFIAQRRYGANDAYAVPYNGEETLLYYANNDQYYVKTGERFSAYQFVVDVSEGPYSVRFQLDSATVAQNNNKSERAFFVLSSDDPVRYDAAAKLLTVTFVYRPLVAVEAQDGLNAAKQQERLFQDAMQRIVDSDAPHALAQKLRDPREGEETPLLLWHLRRYGRRRTSDFFVHKDLERFLERELETYIKQNVMDFGAFASMKTADLDREVRRLRAVRDLGMTVIAFLAQIENFQKRLFEKPKFVVRSNYLVTLDLLPRELYAQLAANEGQIAAWRALYRLPSLEGDVSAATLEALPGLMLDTRLHDQALADAVLAAVPNLEAATNGVLINGENWQALRLLREHRRGTVKCIYIDPPYNTGGDGFLYKDRYQHSSWLAMMYDRLLLARDLLSEDGVIFVSIDDNEVHYLRTLLSLIFGDDNFLAELVWEKTRKNDAKFFSVGHEYMLVYARSLETLNKSGVTWREAKPGAREIMEEYRRLRKLHGKKDAVIEKDLRAWYQSLPANHPSKKLSRYKQIDKYGPWRDRDISWPGGDGPRYDVIHPVTGKPCKVPERGWVFATPESMQEQIRLGLVVFRADDNDPPFRKAHLLPVSGEAVEEDEDDEFVGLQVMPSVIYKQSQVAVKYLRSMMGAKVFDNPKDHEVLARIIRYCTQVDDMIVDFFAGSGTTAHAVLKLNREDGGKRKFVLAEMGAYFESVLVPRVVKACWGDEWKDGAAGAPAGGSHVIRVERLESYEDALNNIEFDETLHQHVLDLFDERGREDYILRYQLDFEAKNSPSLLNIEQLRNPFQYELGISTSEGSLKRTVIDLPATFAYLAGLRVAQRQAFSDDGRRYLVQRGTLPDGNAAVVIWRDLDGIDLRRDEEFIKASIPLEGAKVFFNADAYLAGEPVELILQANMR